MKTKDILVGLFLLAVVTGCATTKKEQLGVVYKVKGAKCWFIDQKGAKYHTYSDRLSFGQKVRFDQNNVTEF